MNDTQLKQLLLDEGYVRESDFDRAENLAKENNISLSRSLRDLNILTKDILGQALAESFGLSYFNLDSHEMHMDSILKIEESVAKENRVILYQEMENQIQLLTDNPQKDLLETFGKKQFPQKTIQWRYVLTEDFDLILKSYKKTLTERIIQIVQDGDRLAPRILDEVFAEALEEKASDIHFEPSDEIVHIRFRIDGVLEEVGQIPFVHYDKILNRIKVQGSMRMDEHFSAQDGAIRTTIQDVPLDIRVSIIPTITGEKITLRLLTRYLQGLTLSDVGFSQIQQNLILKSAKKPFGMILITGPTGAGKTTTLYSLLQLLNTPQVNITTIEDPVEYKIEGVHQIKVNPDTELTFAKGLRSIVRQDPDIILVGEIRDQETAEIAVNASLTGHLLLSSFHANDTATAVVRMLDMGIEPFLLASTLEIVVAQRLVRKICPYTRHSVTYSIEDLEKKIPNARKYFGEGPVTLYEGKPSPLNNNTGYKGRTAIFEFMPMHKDIQDLILKNPSKQAIWDLALQHGALSLFEDGIEKVKQGITTLDELLRVVSPPEI